MAYGLQIFGPSGQTWFDSENAQAGVPVDYISVPGAVYNSGTSTWTPGSYSNTYSSYSNFTLQALYISNMFLTITINSGPAVTNPTVSITNRGVDAAKVLLVATASA